MVNLSADGIRELAAFRPGQGVVTSCYLDVDGRRFPRLAEVEHELDRLLRNARARANGNGRTIAADLAAIERHVKDGVDRSKVRGLAMFSCAADGFWTAYDLPVPVRTQLVVGTGPAVGQLEAALHRHEPIGVLLVDRQQARVLVFKMGELTDYSELLDDLLRDVDDKDEKARGDASGKAEDRDRQHIRRAAAAAFGVYQRHPFAHLLVAAPPAIAGAVEESLHRYLQERLGDRLNLPVNASIEAIGEAAMATEAALERRREQALLDELRGRLARHDRAVAGLGPVLDALADRRVERLLVSGGYHEDGWSCAGCGALAKLGPKCPRCQEAMHEEGDVVASAIDAALTASCRVDVLAESADLDVVGRVGAFLRF
jgi:hypothetical protein